MLPAVRTPALIAAGAVASIVITYFLSTNYAASRFFSLNTHISDLIVTSLPPSKASGEILAVGVTPADAPLYYSKRNPSDLMPVIEKIMSSKPKFAIASFAPHATVSDQELKTFVSFCGKFPNLYFYTFFEEFDAESPAHHPILKNLNWLFIPLAIDGNNPPFDRKVRRLIVKFTLKDSSVKQTLFDLLEKYGLPRRPDEFNTFEVLQSRQTYLRQRGPNAYSDLSFAEFIKNSSRGSDKILVFGTSDFSYELPLYRAHSVYTGKNLTAYERIALALDTLYLRDGVGRVNENIAAGISFILIFFYLVSLLLLTPIQSTFAGFGILAIWMALTTISYIAFDQFLFIAGTAVVIAALHFFASPALLIRYLRSQDRKAAEREKEIALQNERNKLALISARADMGLKIATQVAHDIRAPLSAIQIAGQLDTNKSAEAKKLISSSTDRLNRIADDLLKQFRSGEFSQSSIQEIFLIPFLKEFIQPYKVAHPNAPIQISGNSNAFIQVNKTDLERALSNLLNNCIEAIGEGGGIIQVEVRTTAENCEIHICDNGPGIPPQIRDRLFERGATFGKSKGNGLGLNQVKNAIEAMGGTISLEPSAKGAHFKIVLPRISLF